MSALDGLRQPAVLAAGDLSSIVLDVWRCYVDRDEVPEPDNTFHLDTPGVHATITTRGASNYLIALSLPALTAWRAACLMINSRHPQPQDVTDAVGELTNIIGGNVKSLLPSPSALALPGVQLVDDLEAEMHHRMGDQTMEPLVSVDLNWSGLPMRVSVCSAAT